MLVYTKIYGQTVNLIKWHKYQQKKTEITLNSCIFLAFVRIFIIIIMRKRLVRTLRQSLPRPKQIITFDNKDDNHWLLQPQNSKSKSASSSAQQAQAQVMRISAARANYVCLAANQIEQKIKMIAINRQIIAKEHVQWFSEKYSQPQGFDIYSQPTILKAANLIESRQESISFPFLIFTSRRYNRITVSYKNNSGTRTQKQLQGPRAWIFQHSYQQLNGVIPFDWRQSYAEVQFNKDLIKYFPKSVTVIQQYVADLRKVFQEYPALLQKPEQVTWWQQSRPPLQRQIIPFESDYFNRLIKHYNRQMLCLTQLIQKDALNLPKSHTNSSPPQVKIIK